jgi:31-O-methyltransferase
MTGPNATDTRVVQPQSISLPGGPDIWCTSPAEAVLLWHSITPESVYHLAAARLRAGDAVLDIGANIGVTSLYFSRMCPGLRIVAVEPAPETFACLSRNANDHFGHSDVVRAAVASSRGELSFTYYPNAPGNSSLRADRDRDDANTRTYLRNSGLDDESVEMVLADLHEGVEITVPTTTVSDLIDRYRLNRVALLKVDVERAELDVLRGIEDRHWPLVRQVVAEVHDEGDQLAEFCDLLSRNGLHPEVRQDHGLVGTDMYEVDAVRG